MCAPGRCQSQLSYSHWGWGCGMFYYRAWLWFLILTSMLWSSICVLQRLQVKRLQSTQTWNLMSKMCSWKGQNHGTLEQKIWASFQVVPQMKRMFKVISDSQIPSQTFSDTLNLNHKTKTNTLKTQRPTSIFVLENEHLAHSLSSPSSSTSVAMVIQCTLSPLPSTYSFWKQWKYSHLWTLINSEN